MASGKFSRKFLEQNLTPVLGAAAGLLVVALLLAWAALPDQTWLAITLSTLLVATLAGLIHQNRRALRSRSVAFGAQSSLTVVLVIGIVGVLNFLAARYPLKWDLTAGKLHTLSTQSVSVAKALKQPVQAILWAKAGEREKYKPLLDNFKGLNPKFEVENVDPDREPTRARDAGIKRYGTLQLKFGAKESKIEDPTEEKLTNALIKLTKDKTATVCAITGHGEKSMSANTADGYEAARKQLLDQSYTVRDYNLVQDSATAPLAQTCDAIVILGPTHAFFEAEAKALREYLTNGGRAVVALDLNLKGAEATPELLSLLESWYIKPSAGLVIDPLSKMLGSDAAVPILATYAKDHAITKEFQTQCFFPFTRPLEILPNAPAELKVQWLAQSTPKSFVVTDMKALASGQARVQPGKDAQSARNVAAAVEGRHKSSNTPRPTRLVVFGSSQFANNQWARFGGNLDFFLNAVSWALEDESLISIRSKEDGGGRIELSSRAGNVIGLLTVFLIPLAIAAAGIAVWFLRRRK